MGRYKFDKFGGEYLSESTIKGIAADLCKNANINRYLYDWAVLAFGTVVIFTASVIQERSQRTIREILDEKCLALRWAVLLAGIFAVVLMGVYGPGVQASEFVYMQF